MVILQTTATLRELYSKRLHTSPGKGLSTVFVLLSSLEPIPMGALGPCAWFKTALAETLGWLFCAWKAVSAVLPSPPPPCLGAFSFYTCGRPWVTDLLLSRRRSKHWTFSLDQWFWTHWVVTPWGQRTLSRGSLRPSESPDVYILHVTKSNKESTMRVFQ